MDSTLSHDSYAFAAPNALHGDLLAAPNQHGQFVHTRPIGSIAARFRPGFQQSSIFAPRLPEDYAQQYSSAPVSPMYNGGFSMQQQQQQQHSNTNVDQFYPATFNNFNNATNNNNVATNNTIAPTKLTPLTISAINPHNRSMQSSPISSSTPSSASPRTQVFSRRSDGITGSPPRTGQTDVLFCRTANPHGRQRTAQACEKCRDRKTKCSGERPICKRCKDRGLTCEWAPETRVRGPQRTAKASRLSSEEKDSPRSQLAVITTARSHPNSPLNPSSRLDANIDLKSPRSAPPHAPGFPPLLSTSGKLIGVVNDPRRSTWPPGLSSAVQQGRDAEMIMGQPIVSITPSSDCWGSIADAEVVETDYMSAHPRGVSLFDPAAYILQRVSAGESSGTSSSPSPPSVDAHTLPTLGESSGSQRLPAPMPMSSEHADMMQAFGLQNFDHPIDPSLLGMLNDQAPFAYSPPPATSVAPADDATPVPGPSTSQKKDEEIMDEYFDIEAFEQS